MGLDMYLDRFPRGYEPKKVLTFEDWLEWREKEQDCPFEEWTGRDEKDLPNAKESEFLKTLYTERYYAWDTGHHFPHKAVHEQVGYWRKANAIHKWFVDNVQDGEDDCEYHREVEKEDIEGLRDICKDILLKVVLAPAKIENGYTLTRAGKQKNYVEGLKIVNPEVCWRLPTQEGFFFGGTEYTEWYLDDVKKTFELMEKLLEETDFEKFALYYRSSW